MKFEDRNLYMKIWEVDSPVAVLQIAHGMTEHIERYDRFANYLNKHNIIVAGYDLRGHGHNSNNPVATFKENGWKESIEDIHYFNDYLNQKYPSAPKFILGFSLGSFLVRDYLHDYNDNLNGAIIMGTGTQPSIILSIIMKIVETQIKKNGFDNTTELVQKLSFDTYNSKFKPNKTKFDWLCSDEVELNKYRNDQLCKDSISSGLFHQLLDSMKRNSNSNIYESWNKNIPILLVSGEEDPVGDFKKGVLTLEKEMNKYLNNVELKLYKGRHDILHEESNQTAEHIRRLISDFVLHSL